MSRLRITALLCWVPLLGLLPSSTLAQGFWDPEPFSRPGLYVGLGATIQSNLFESEIENEVEDVFGSRVSSLDLDFQDSGGFNAVVGYRAASFFALELAYEWVSQYDIDASAKIRLAEDFKLAGHLYSIDGHTLTANTKWILPFSRVQPYLLLGGGIAVSQVERGGLFDEPAVELLLEREGIEVDEGRHVAGAGRLGLGLDLHVTRHTVISALVGVLITTLKEPQLEDIDDLNYVSVQVGLQYRF